MKLYAGHLTALHNRGDVNQLSRIRKQVVELAETFPLYSERRARLHALRT